MKKKLLFFIMTLLSVSSFAQSYRWATSSGTSGKTAKAIDVCSDANGNVYTTGNFTGTITFGATTLTAPSTFQTGYITKQDLSGNYQWAIAIGGNNGDFTSNAIAFFKGKDLNGVDYGENVYVTGCFEGNNTDFNPSTTVTSLDNAGYTDAFVARYSASSGAYGWASRTRGTGNEIGYGIAVNANGVYSCGAMTGEPDFNPGDGKDFVVTRGGNDAYVWRLEVANGNIFSEWSSATMGGTLNDYAYDVALDATGNVYVTGSFASQNTDFTPGDTNDAVDAKGGSDGFLEKFNDYLAAQWVRPISGTSNESGKKLTIDAAGSIYVAGEYEGAITCYDNEAGTAGTKTLTNGTLGNVFVTKYSDAGVCQWADKIGGSDVDKVSDVCYDKNSNSLYVTGSFSGTADFDPSDIATAEMTSFGSSDGFIAKLNAAGVYQWAKQVGGTDEDVATGLTVLPNDVEYVSGYFSGTADFDPSTYARNKTASGTTDCFVLGLGNVSVSSTGGTTSSTYGSFSQAISAINSGAHTGSISVALGCCSYETASVVLNASGTGSSSYTDINIYPTSDNITITGALNGAPLFDLNGADNVTIDGRSNKTGTTPHLTFVNTSNSNVTGTSTLRLLNDATGNNIQYCQIKGSETNNASGVLFVSTGTTAGNDNNTIQNNILTASENGRPFNAIYSLGTASKSNSGNTLASNTFVNLLNATNASNIVALGSNNTGWTISNNTFYETDANFSATGAAIKVIDIQSGNGYSILNNKIGGAASDNSGSWKIGGSASFFGINLTQEAGTSSNLQGNTIKNFSVTGTGTPSWTGISVTNGVLASMSTNAITNIALIGAGFNGITLSAVTGALSGNTVSTIASTTGGITALKQTTSTITSTNNTISNLQTTAGSVYGVYAIGGSRTSTNDVLTGLKTGKGNLFGVFADGATQTTTGCNINNLQTADGNLYGTYAKDASQTILKNVITTLVSDKGEVAGIFAKNCSGSIANSSISNLATKAVPTSVEMESQLNGIELNACTAFNLSGDTIYNLTNTTPTTTHKTSGIDLVNCVNTTVLTGNFIHGLSTTYNANIYGVRKNNCSAKLNNNVISLGTTVPTIGALYGLADLGSESNSSLLGYNTINIGGTSPDNDVTKTYALYFGNTNASSIQVQNNILVNSRSTVGGSNLHYATFYGFEPSSQKVTTDHNDYFTPGVGGALQAKTGSTSVQIPLFTDADSYSVTLNPLFKNASSTSASDYLPTNVDLRGAVLSGITTDYAGITRSTTMPAMGAFEYAIPEPSVNIVATAGLPAGTYNTLNNAFNAINNGAHKGNIQVKISKNLTLASSAVLNASGEGLASYNSLQIYPTTAATISGSLAGSPLIDLNGSDKVVIDGRLNAQENAAPSLTLTNASVSTNAGTSTIRFINDASNNTVKYCTIKGSTRATGGLVHFSTAKALGNSNNSIINNDITADAAGRPYAGVYSLGTALMPNKTNLIQNNNIYDILSLKDHSFGVLLDDNTEANTVSGNSIYETAAVTMTSTSIGYSYGIGIWGGSNNIVSSNFIGGSSKGCIGTWQFNKTAYPVSFLGIDLRTTDKNTIQDNIVKNITMASSIGTYFKGINTLTGSNSTKISGNTVTLINGLGDATQGYLIGIYCEGVEDYATGNTLSSLYNVNNQLTGITCAGSKGKIWNNTVNDLDCSGSELSYGIQITSATAASVKGNTVYNLNNSANAAGSPIIGIYSYNSSDTIANNIVRDMTSYSSNNVTGIGSTIVGIGLDGATHKDHLVSSNLIYNLKNTSTTGNTDVVGIVVANGTEKSVIDGNFVRDMSLKSAGTSAYLIGIRPEATGLFTNNIISLGKTTTTGILMGFYENAPTSVVKCYHNTINIEGSGSMRSAGYYCKTAFTVARDIQNNIFNMTRVGTESNTYVLSFPFAPSATAYTKFLTLDNNAYWSSTSIFLYADGYFSAIPFITGKDANSKKINPNFKNAGSTTPSDYLPGAALNGATNLGVTIDFRLRNRNQTYFTMGAIQPAITTWNGSTWNNLAPEFMDDIVFDGTYNNAGFPCKSLTVNADKKMTVSSGTMAVSGNLYIKSSAAGTGTILEDGGTLTLGGTANVEQFVYGKGGATPNNRYYYLSSPVTGATSTFVKSTATDKLWSFIEPNVDNTVNGVYALITDLTTTLELGKGYVARFGADRTLTYSGTLNKGNIDVSVSRTGRTHEKRGYNLVGNPYASFVTLDPASNTNLLPTIWYRSIASNLNGMAFDTYNYQLKQGVGASASGVPTQYIHPMQAFWVRVKADGTSGKVAFKEANRSHNSSNVRLRADQNEGIDENQIIRLSVNNGLSTDETLIAFCSEASDLLDDYDSPKMANESASIPEIFTFAGNEELAINGLNKNGSDRELAIGFRTLSAGEFTIKAKEMLNMEPGTRIYLRDNMLKTQVDLTCNPEYSFASEVTNTAGRFSLILSKTATDISSIQKQDFYLSETSDRAIDVFLNGLNTAKTVVTLTNALGQTLETAKVNSNNQRIGSSLTPGLYLVNVKADGFNITKKIIVNN